MTVTQALAAIKFYKKKVYILINDCLRKNESNKIYTQHILNL